MVMAVVAIRSVLRNTNHGRSDENWHDHPARWVEIDWWAVIHRRRGDVNRRRAIRCNAIAPIISIATRPWPVGHAAGAHEKSTQTQEPCDLHGWTPLTVAMGVRYAHQAVLLRGRALGSCFDWLQTLSVCSALQNSLNGKRHARQIGIVATRRRQHQANR